MSLEDIKRISIREYLRCRGINPKTENPHAGMYISPLRDETTPSFRVDYARNLWYDHGLGEGGSIIDLVMRLEHFDFSAAVERLEGGDGNMVASRPSTPMLSPAIEITEIRPLYNPALVEYLTGRAIDPAIASEHCREVHYRINGRPYFAIGLKNDAGGWELRNARFKGGSTPKNITTIRNDSDTCMVFEGFMDFLAYLTMKENAHPRIDTAVLNSVTNLVKAVPFLSEHRTIHAFLDNDEAGRKTTAEIGRLVPSAEVIDQSHFYRAYKDVNDYWREKSNLINAAKISPPAPKKHWQIPVKKKSNGPKL